MLLHELDVPIPAAVVALAPTCAALITADADVHAELREGELWQVLFAALLDHSCLMLITPKPAPGWSGFLVTTRQQRQVMPRLTLLASLEPRLDQTKLSLLQRLARPFQVEPGVVADLQQV